MKDALIYILIAVIVTFLIVGISMFVVWFDYQMKLAYYTALMQEIYILLQYGVLQ